MTHTKTFFTLSPYQPLGCFVRIVVLFVTVRSRSSKLSLAKIRAFQSTPQKAVCPKNLPQYDYSAEYRDNSHARYCVKTYPDKFAAIGLLVGYRLYSPADKENARRLEQLIKADGLSGRRLSPIYDPDVVWLNDPVCERLSTTHRNQAAALSRCVAIPPATL
jgi:hypothetical protein